MSILRVLQQMTSPSFGMMCSNSQLAGAHPFLSLFSLFCHRHQMECFLFSELRIFSLSSSLFAWFSGTPFLSFVFYLFFCWIFAVVLVCCLGIRFQKWLLDIIYHHILHQLLRWCLPDLGGFTLCTSCPSVRLCPMAPFGMMCSNSQLTSAHPCLSLFIFSCHRHHMGCFLFSDLNISFNYRIFAPISPPPPPLI